MLLQLFIYTAVVGLSPAFSEPDNILRSKRSDEYVPCEAEWYYFRDKCYRAWGWNQETFEGVSWETALERCRNYGGDLVSIQSQDEQDFVVSFLQLDVRSWAWIGLNDRDSESNFKWTDGSAVNYTNWKHGEPSRKGGNYDEEDCVQLCFEPENSSIGKWNDRLCDTPEAYICEKNASPSNKSSNPIYFSSEEGRGWKFQNSWYHLVTERKTWQNAEEYCRDNYNGHLVSILDTLEDFFLDYILADTRKELLWLGIKMQNQLQQKWSSGWYVLYDDFKKEQTHFIGDTCTARKMRKEWITIKCTNVLSFICKVSKDSPPVLKLPARGSHCPIEMYWRDLGGEYCYYIDREKELNFYDASFDCNRKGGNVLSLHSKEESDMLLSFFKYTQRSIFIGLLVQGDKFAWTDGSTVDYEYWNTNEPNNIDEKCTEAITHDNKLQYSRARLFSWNDIRCELKRSYICSVKKISPSLTFEEEMECTCHVSVKSLIAVIVCFFLLIIFLGAMVYYFRPCRARHRHNSTSTSRAYPYPSTNHPKNVTTAELLL